MKKSQTGFGTLEIILLVIVVGLLGTVGWLVYDRHHTAQKPASSQSSTQTTTQPNSGWETEATSGQGAFSIRFPDGWKDITKDNSRDFFIIPGQKQPELKAGQPAQVTAADNFGSDGPVVFMVLIDDNFAPPQGTATDYVLENGKEHPITGKKYTYIYPEDQNTEGLGAGRLKGDRNYTYVFKVSDTKELRVYYSVYATDPRNNVETVEEIIRYIRLLK